MEKGSYEDLPLAIIPTRTYTGTEPHGSGSARDATPVKNRNFKFNITIAFIQHHDMLEVFCFQVTQKCANWTIMHDKNFACISYWYNFYIK